MNDAEMELAAALGFAFLAGKFVIESETWPVFLAHVDANTSVRRADGWTREKMSKLVDVLQQLMELDAAIAGEDL